MPQWRLVVPLAPNTDIMLSTKWWWWERLLLGLWILMSLVLAKSYAGNLMSLLAVRYVPQPFQTLRDVVDDPRVVIVGQKHSSFERNLRVNFLKSDTRYENI